MRDVSTNPAYIDELVQLTGRRALPVIVIGDEVVQGFDRGRISSLLGIG